MHSGVAGLRNGASRPVGYLYVLSRGTEGFAFYLDKILRCCVNCNVMLLHPVGVCRPWACCCIVGLRGHMSAYYGVFQNTNNYNELLIECFRRS